MPTKRTTRTLGTKRITRTTSYKNGKTTSTYSESTAGKTKPGQTRVTNTYKNGKPNSIRTMNMGNGWYNRESSAGRARAERIQSNKSRKFWNELFGNTKRKTPKKASGVDAVFWCVVLFFMLAVFWK